MIVVKAAWWRRLGRALLMGGVFVAGLLVLLIVAGGAFVLLAMAYKSDQHLAIRAILALCGVGMVCMLWSLSKEYFQGWFPRRR